MPERIIAHIDLDAFYCQVEHVRLNIPIDIPLVVQQWNGIIAVNYAARAVGIKRHCTIQEAKQKCPELRLVHVATYAEGESEPRYHEKPIYSTHKVSLDVYRNASIKIFEIIGRFCNKIERGSIDEAYIDLSNLKPDHSITSKDASNYFDELINASENEKSLFPMSETDSRLLNAASVIHKIRSTIKQELGYTCSAGIAINKTMAKLCSSLHKPNKQTILRQENTLKFIKSIPFQKIKNLGGKLGFEIEKQLSCELAGEIIPYSKEELCKKFNYKVGTWIYNICRGICHDPVNERTMVNSMSACKSFRPYINDLNGLNRWIDVLASELFNRVMDSWMINKRWPNQITIRFKNTSKSIQMISQPLLDSHLKLSKKMRDLVGDSSISFPLSRISFCLSGFCKIDKGLVEFMNRNQTNQKQKQPNQTNEIDQTNEINETKLLDIKETSINNDKIITITDIPLLDETGHFLCHQCQSRIFIEDEQEHEDYHLAVRLTKSINQSQQEPIKKKRKLNMTDYFS